MTGFTAEQNGLLVQPLKREHIHGRTQANRTVSYLEAWHVIAEANRIFGFDGWSREMMDCRCVAERETKIGQATDRQGNSQQQRDGWRVGYVARVRITVGSVVREGCGYGSGIDVDLGSAHESALKEAESDAMKRALMTFGNQFGLALYDKSQANVEAPARSSLARPTTAGSRSTPSENPAGQTARTPNATSAAPSHTRSSTGNGHGPLKLSEVRDAIIHALEVADSRDRVDGIIRVHQRDLELIQAAHIPTHDRLLRLAEERKAALVEPPLRTDARSAPALMGEP